MAASPPLFSDSHVAQYEWNCCYEAFYSCNLEQLMNWNSQNTSLRCRYCLCYSYSIPTRALYLLSNTECFLYRARYNYLVSWLPLTSSILYTDYLWHHQACIVATGSISPCTSDLKVAVNRSILRATMENVDPDTIDFHPPSKKRFGNLVKDNELSVMKSTVWAMNCFREWLNVRNVGTQEGDEDRCPKNLLDNPVTEIKTAGFVDLICFRGQKQIGRGLPTLNDTPHPCWNATLYMLERDPSVPKSLNKGETCFHVIRGTCDRF